MIKKKLRTFLAVAVFTSIFSLGFLHSEEAKAYNAGGDGIIRINSWDINNFNSTADLWTQTRANYDPEEVKDRVVSGDFDGNGKDEIAAFYDYGNSTTKMHRFYESGGVYQSPTAWSSWTGKFNADSITGRVVSGDFNGDGKDEIVALYDYKDATVTMFQFSLNSDEQTFSDKSVWSSKSFTGDRVTAMVAGDFDGDRKDEVLIFYDYGNNVTGMFELKMNSNGTFTDRYAWECKTYNSNCMRNKTVAGDFNGDGKDEVAMFYDYGNATTKVWSLYNTNNVYSDKLTWESSSFAASQIDGKVVATHNKNGSKDKIIALYDYRNNVTGIFTLEMNDNSKFTDRKINDLNNYEADRIKGRVTVGNYNGQAIRLAAMYDGTVVQSQTQGEKVVAEAKEHLGKPYVWSATGPNSFDCSGFTQFVYRESVGIYLPRVISSYMSSQRGVGTKVSNISDLRVGDLVITNNYNHVGIYVGNGQYINAQGDDLGNTPGLAYKVVISNIYGFNEGRRVL
ncbi:NlpC/P60 family protein [Clostridium sartagoforme]|uniref:NlpC/P60 family protein n=1 Tax=Clostridium sartagoforme TaxID=84031 RepID=UPI0031E40997